MPFDLPIERLFDGRPLISPTENWWESGVTFNSAAVYLPADPAHARAFDALLGPGAMERHPDGIAVLHYRARPKHDPGHRWTRSFIGLSVHEPDLTPIRRFEEPVLSPGGSECDADFEGVEDPRVTFLDGAWWMAYCGVRPEEDGLFGAMCLARSTDLVHWQKCGEATGEGDAFAGRSEMRVGNKDGVLLPDRVGGKVYMLHRPMRGPQETWATCLASADEPTGPYCDHGPIHWAASDPQFARSWVGAGSVPIPIGGRRFVSIEHTGGFYPDGRRRYVLDAFLYDFNRFDGREGQTLMAARMDDIMRPETDFEVNGPFPDSVANVVFACGSYVHHGWLYIVYGGGDSYILAARMRFADLVAALEARVAG